MLKEHGWLLFIAIIICIFSFPFIDPVYSTGLDPGYFWAFNYFFDQHKTEVWQKLIYPIGPLGFLEAPYCVGSNLMIGISIIFATKILFLFSLLSLGFRMNGNKISVLHIAITFIVSYFAGLDFSIAGTAGVLLILFKEKESKIFFIAACLVASFGWYIKSSIGVLSFSIIFSFAIIDLFTQKRVVKLIFYFLSSLLSLFAVGILIFKNPVSVLTYSFNTIKLILGYSNALALYPENNWWALTAVIASFILFPFLCKDRRLNFAYAIFAFSIFAAWKHSISREDIFHYKVLLFYFPVFFGILTVYAQQLNKYNLIIPFLIISLFYSNSGNLDTSSPITFDMSSVKNFHRAFFDTQQWNKKSEEESTKNIQENIVEDSVRKIINQQSIDIYPWDISYIPANNFNYKPRTTLQLIAFNSWLDKESAANFSLTNGPAFILFHVVNDKWGTDVGSLDNRYLLNDEPKTIAEILNNYNLIFRNNKFVLFKKADKNKLEVPQIIKSEILQWKNWIKVPEVTNGILRVQVNFKENFLEKLKSLFFKGEQFFIEYKFADDKVFRYRFTSGGAEDGLWIHPFITSIHTNTNEQRVKEIRLLCSNYSLYKNEISIDWEVIKVKKELNNYAAGNNEYLLFGKESLQNQQNNYLFQSKNDYEKPAADWSTPSTVDSSEKYSGKYAEIVKKESYSSTMRLKMDSIIFDTAKNIIVEAGVWIYAHPKTDGNLVISFEKDGKAITWDAANTKDNILDEKEWNFIYLKKKMDVEKIKGSELSIYFWNSGKENLPVFLDDFSVKIKTGN